jgi:hypothetical protein
VGSLDIGRKTAGSVKARTNENYLKEINKKQ